MPAPHPNLCGCLPTIICCQQGYHTLHASPPPTFFGANSKHLPLPTEVANLACNIAGTQGKQPVFWISEHNFRTQFPSVLRYPSVVQPCMQYREHFRNRGQHQNFRALLEHGLPWVTVFGPTSFDWGPKNSTKGRGIQESTANSQIAKLLASQEKISRGGVLRHVCLQQSPKQPHGSISGWVSTWLCACVWLGVGLRVCLGLGLCLGLCLGLLMSASLFIVVSMFASAAGLQFDTPRCTPKHGPMARLRSDTPRCTPKHGHKP